MSEQVATPEVSTPSTTSSPATTTETVVSSPDTAAAVATPAVSSEPKVETPAVEAAPVDEGYDLELADDSPLSDEELNEIAEEAGRLSLSKEDAEKLIAAREKAYKKGESKVESAYKAKLEASYKEIVSDPMFQGEQKAKSFESMNRAIQTFGDDDLVKLVNTPEFGNNVVLARFLKRLGDVLAPATETLTGGNGSAGQSKASGDNTLKNMYPQFFDDKK